MRPDRARGLVFVWPDEAHFKRNQLVTFTVEKVGRDVRKRMQRERSEISDLSGGASARHPHT